MKIVSAKFILKIRCLFTLVHSSNNSHALKTNIGRSLYLSIEDHCSFNAFAADGDAKTSW